MKRVSLAGLILALLASACGTLEVGLEPTPTLAPVTVAPTQTVLPPPPTVTIPTDAVPYHNPALGLSLMLPAGWTVYGPMAATQQGFDFYALGPDAGSEGGPDVSQLIVADAATLTAEQFLHSYCSLCTFSPFEAVQADGLIGQRTTLTSDTTPSSTWTFFIHAGQLLGFSLRPRDGQNFDWVLGTLTFETPTGSTPTPTAAAVSACAATYTNLSQLFCVDAQGSATLIADHSADGTLSDPLLADDGAWIAYLLNKIDGTTQLWGMVLNTSERVLLADASLLTTSDPNIALSPLRPQWQPDTHNLFFTTRFTNLTGEQGPGEHLIGDLWQVNADTHTLTNLLPGQSLSAFTFAPDGQLLALTTAQSVRLAQPSLADLRSVIEFPFIATMSEYTYKPTIVWSPDSAFFSVIIPSADPLASDAHADLYRVSRAGEAQKRLTLSGNFVFGTNPLPQVSPDGAFIVYGRIDPNTQNTDLHLVNVQTQKDDIFVQGPLFGLGWAPDSLHYAYNANGIGNLMGVAEPNQVFGTTDAAPSNLVWVNGSTFYFAAQANGQASLFSQQFNTNPQLLASGLENYVAFDVRR